MCLIVFANECHPEYELILAANRDEFYGRPTRPAQFWEDNPHILAGKDLKSGGSWMGISRTGQLAALTNFRDPSITKDDPPSRGEIVIDYLKQPQSGDDFLAELEKRANRYNGFNVLAGKPGALYHYSNQEHVINRVEPGIHGLSNHLLDTPWPKVKRAKTELEVLLNRNEVTPDLLFGILENDMEAASDQLPDTGIPRELEKQISPIFIQTEDYGTRSSTILLIDQDGHVTFEERRFKPGTKEVEDTVQVEFEAES